MTNNLRGRPDITVRRICPACATKAARRDPRDQFCLICASLESTDEPATRPSRRDTQ
jgi:hypothetical protein